MPPKAEAYIAPGKRVHDDQKISAVAKLFSGSDSAPQVINEKNSRGPRARG